MILEEEFKNSEGLAHPTCQFHHAVYMYLTPPADAPAQF